MFRKLVQIVHIKAGSKAVVLGVAAAGLVALAGGWSFAALRPGHTTAPTGPLTAASLHSAGSTVRDSSQGDPQAAGPQAGTPQTTVSPSAGPQPGATMPAGLLIAGPQALASSAGGGSTVSDHSATGGGSTSFFQFGFTAQSHRNGKVAGTVTGNAEIVFTSPNSGHLHIEVNCVEIVGNDAYVSGVLTNSAFGLTKGTEMLFGVEDDDSAAKPDLISDIFFSPAPPFTCHTFHAKPHYSVQGNVEIH
jgi:hypothetical protein